MDQPLQGNFSPVGDHAVAITMEKDTSAHSRSRSERRGIQRALGFKNVVIYVLVFVNLLLCSRLFSTWSRQNYGHNKEGYCKPTGSSGLLMTEEPEGGHEGDGEDASTPEFWIKMALIVLLVLTGGVFAGLTIGLMGLDETNLHVLMASGTPKERSYAETVYKLLSRGKHWVLVTLLLGNVIVNETLPVVLDSELGGGIVAILISTLLIVIFGEIIPQAVCARHGLAIGAYCAKPMLVFMYIMSPAAYPIAMLLDSWLGVHHGTTYRRTELKTLVSLHQMDGIGELTDDEVTIIASVLDLKEKPVSSVMTPLEDVFTLSEDAILDEQLMEEIMSAGYSRIPIYRHDDPSNFIGMLLVKRLITYDPEDHIPVRQFTINSLPEAAPNTSCLDILNFFQEGRSHMAIVTSEPGGFGLPVGVITLEDVIEELLGEEIVDESDVYVDVHNKIKVIRKTSKNANMIKSLKTLLRSPAIGGATVGESTPLLAGATRSSTIPVDSKYMTSGKTILQTRSASIGKLDLTAAANATADAQQPAADSVGNKDTSADVIRAEGQTTTTDSEPVHPFATESVPVNHKDESNGHKHGHVNFKKDDEVIQPAESETTAATTTPSNQTATEQPEQCLVIDVPEATGTYPINPTLDSVATAINATIASAPEATEVTESSEPHAAKESSDLSGGIPESSSTATLLTTPESNTNSPASSASKKKKKKKGKK
ncbi:hypothetical protein BGZ98_007637 [Dissophora globulifera]|nr:hypothetical protein BGZ98_007637 [Dissophora globulifera]